MSPDHTAAFRPAPLGSGAARSDDDRLRAAGYAAGWAAGARAAAEAAAEAEHRRVDEAAQAHARRDAALARALETLGQVSAAVAAQHESAAAEVAVAVHRAAIELAEAILRRELTPGPASALGLLERALSQPADAGLHTVRVSPADHDQVMAVLDSRQMSLPDGVRLVVDPTLMAGDVVSEHAAVVLDGRISAALDRARRALEDQT